MPAITVSDVSSSVETRNVGSSLRKRARALPSLSEPSRLDGEMAILMTGSGTNMFSSEQYLFSAA